MKRAMVFFLLLGGCEGQSAPDARPTPSSLEAAAIEAGVISDPANTDPTGLYARDRDKICIVPSATAFRVGIYIDYGNDYFCSASGEATRARETLHVELTSAPGCSFDAKFDGDRIAIPGALPDGCQKACWLRRRNYLFRTVPSAACCRFSRRPLACRASRFAWRTSRTPNASPSYAARSGFQRVAINRISS